ncbi:MAG: ABC transporter ATP-binding protein [Rhodospirillales bacterium]|nr:ABC transporter ATP-binding protein [Rhodospirillales bacterium]
MTAALATVVPKAAPAPDATIRLCDLTVAYDRHPAIHHVSGAFRPGSLTAVVGPNGAGKTTLLKAIVGLLRPAEGRVELQGIARRDIAYLPQQAEIDRSFPISVLDTILTGYWREVGALGRIDGAMVERARQALASIGLAGFEDRPIGTLSAGQFQRVLFARVMLQDARVILLDEPFNAIDARTTRDLLDRVRSWHDERRTVIAVLHDMEMVREHFPEAVLVARECLGWGATAEVASPQNLLRARRMSEAWDDAADTCHVHA